jgi:hypothetical protein
MDPWSKFVLASMAVIAVATILSVLIERDQRREEAERDDPDPRNYPLDRPSDLRKYGTRLPVDGAVSQSGAHVSDVRQNDRGLVMRDQMTAEERRKRFTRVGQTARTGTSPYRSDRRESHS